MNANALEQDLLRCFERCAPRDRVRIEQTAALAARLSDLDLQIREHGCDEEEAQLHRSWLHCLTGAITVIGPDRIYGTNVVSILARGYATAAATFEVLPPMGTA